LSVVVDHSSRRIAATNARMLEIEDMMAEAGGRYWKSEALQAEYRALLDGADRQVEAISQPALSPEAAAAYSTANELGTRMDVALGDALPGVEAAFDGYSAALKHEMWREMARGLPTDSEPANWDELTGFSASPAGKILESWWGRDTDHNLGILIKRADRMEAHLSDEDLEDWNHFLTHPDNLDVVCAIFNEIVQ
jgi:hypothetical protein